MALRNAFETLATESKQDDLNTLVEALNTASASILAAVQAINGKVTACNTGAVTVSNMVGQGLTDGQLRASAVPVSLTSVPAHSVSVSNSPTVALDSASLAALESVTISNQIAQPLTLAQLQGDDVKISLDGESV